MEYGIRYLIRKIHYVLPPEIRNSYRFIIIFFRRIGYSIMPVKHYIVKDNESGELFTFVHIGWDKKLCHYWLNRFSDKFETGSGNGTIASWSIPKFLKDNHGKIDLVIIDSSKKAISGKYPYSFLLPRWMEMELDIESSLKKTRVKNITRNIKKHSLDYEIREGMEAFDLFYHKMYKPYLLKRHGNSADIAEYKHFSNKYSTEKCVLFFIIKENEPVASAFIEVKNNGYRVSAFGILDGSDEIFKMGVIGALYYFVMLYYYRKGVHSLLVGNSMPVAFDGVTEFKMQIGAEPYLNDLEGKHKFYFIPINAKPWTMKILKSNPLFYLTDDHLHIASFISARDYDNKDDFLKFFRRLKSENVEKTKIYFFDNYDKIIHWMNEEDITNIEFSKYECITPTLVENEKIQA